MPWFFDTTRSNSELVSSLQHLALRSATSRPRLAETVPSEVLVGTQAHVLSPECTNKTHSMHIIILVLMGEKKLDVISKRIRLQGGGKAVACNRERLRFPSGSGKNAGPDP